ncbi:hypothetical protein [Sphingomonas turrisvirgatae]|uniref:hypothetical protein n=1 Tax=Sphingomonas turrisvirgatae TaxID=1888892 RepID=UPI00104236DC|nr:hypothetical protein [Sphingomonas turrisvirgatae]
MRKPLMLGGSIMLLATLPAAVAMPAPKPVWTVTRTTDPITGATSCVVAAYDKAAGMSFSRTGAIYPFVENSSIHGILVGVSSGGRIRLPTGDIVWRVDDRPFRTLRAADNPPGAAGTVASPDDPAMKQLIEQQMKLVAAATATSTVAAGALATEMLQEMLGGKGLVYRAAAASVSYGLPDGQRGAVGQYTKDGLRPYPLDASFREGLAACGIAVE